MFTSIIICILHINILPIRILKHHPHYFLSSPPLLYYLLCDWLQFYTVLYNVNLILELIWRDLIRLDAGLHRISRRKYHRQQSRVMCGFLLSAYHMSKLDDILGPMIMLSILNEVTLNYLEFLQFEFLNSFPSSTSNFEHPPIFGTVFIANEHSPSNNFNLSLLNRLEVNQPYRSFEDPIYKPKDIDHLSGIPNVAKSQ